MVDVPSWVRDLLEPFAGPGVPLGARGTRAGATVFRVGEAVAKVHRMGTDAAALAVRLAACADARTPLLAPLHERVVAAPDGRPVTIWPWVEVLHDDGPDLPWRASGALLATLHSSPVADALPAHGWIPRLQRAAARAPEALKPLGHRLVAEACGRDEPRVLLHGDWHLGQLGRPRGAGGWRLLDPDDLGWGHPAWDLARPAGFWAAGLLADAEWGSFLDAYAEACTRGVLAAWGPAAHDPWIALDLPARCAVYVAATAGIHSEDIAEALHEACLRMAQ